MEITDWPRLRARPAVGDRWSLGLDYGTETFPGLRSVCSRGPHSMRATPVQQPPGLINGTVSTE